MRKELSPLSGRSHVVYDLSTQLFIFGDGVGAVEDAVFLIFKRDTPKAVGT
jgi:hypothetical protein